MPVLLCSVCSAQHSTLQSHNISLLLCAGTLPAFDNLDLNPSLDIYVTYYPGAGLCGTVSMQVSCIPVQLMHILASLLISVAALGVNWRNQTLNTWSPELRLAQAEGLAV
jgi:hypothetical protein